MKLLLDTHVLLWWLDGAARLPARLTNRIADPANDVLVSVVSLWEIAVKCRIGKLEADLAEIAAVVPREGMRVLGLEIGHLAALMHLPVHHRDPFDHLLIAQAIAEDAWFVTLDRNARFYPVRRMQR